jgi:hypothetical protein
MIGPGRVVIRVSTAEDMSLHRTIAQACSLDWARALNVLW